MNLARYEEEHLASSAQLGPPSSVEPTVRPGHARQVAMKRERDRPQGCRTTPRRGASRGPPKVTHSQRPDAYRERHLRPVSNAIERVGVIGAGQMGAGIAEVSAKAGADVVVFEPTDELAAAGKARIEASLDRAVSS